MKHFSYKGKHMCSGAFKEGYIGSSFTVIILTYFVALLLGNLNNPIPMNLV